MTGDDRQVCLHYRYIHIEDLRLGENSLHTSVQCLPSAFDKIGTKVVAKQFLTRQLQV